MIGEPLSKDWKYIGGLILLRLKKSGIEYVVLAGYSLLTLLGLNPGMGRVWRLPGGAQSAIFSMTLAFLHLKSQISLVRRGISRFGGGPEGKSREGRVWIFTPSGQISLETSGNAKRGGPSNFQRNF